mgnify:CR=1 FL=1|tara:strand:+ start:318 stop:1007 length:690 start_codon:yes stop_codon:yes gene_type:complete
MNKLEHFFLEKVDKTLQSHKWLHYFKIYDKHFKRFIGKKPVVLEIGVDKGGSLEMWNYYFDNDCTIYGLDINENSLDVPKKLGASNIKVDIGDQGDPKFWKEYLKDKPKFDIVIDDGGHTMKQQIITYESVYDHISDDGVYLCEDTHTSYYEGWGGESLFEENGIYKSHRNPNTFVEYSKNWIDQINSYHISGCSDFRFRRITNSIHFYDSVVVLEKEIDNNRPASIVR